MKIVETQAILVNPYKNFMSDKDHLICQLKNVELAGRNCYKSEEKITSDSYISFVSALIKKKHLAMLEHGEITFRFIVDRGVSHELVRHRMASYAQESTRYCNYTSGKFHNQLTFIQPDFKNPECAIDWLDTMQFIEQAYFKLIDSGAKPEMARSVLPSSLKTEVIMTANLREWLHFIELRTAHDAHPQIRKVAIQVKKILEELAPCLFF